MSYLLKTDDEILHDLAEKLDLIRRTKKIKDSDLVQRGGTNRVVLNKFRKGTGGISLKTFVRLLRGLGELDRLENCFSADQPFSPAGSKSDIPKKRVRDKTRNKNGFVWGEDE